MRVKIITRTNSPRGKQVFCTDDVVKMWREPRLNGTVVVVVVVQPTILNGIKFLLLNVVQNHQINNIIKYFILVFPFLCSLPLIIGRIFSASPLELIIKIMIWWAITWLDIPFVLIDFSIQLDLISIIIRQIPLEIFRLSIIIYYKVDRWCVWVCVCVCFLYEKEKRVYYWSHNKIINKQNQKTET